MLGSCKYERTMYMFNINTQNVASEKHFYSEKAELELLELEWKL